MTELLMLLNRLANRCAEYVLAPIAVLPGWLSATLVAVATGVFMLLVFKYTSNQRSVQRVRDQIKANLLALSLFKDSVAVSLRCQRRVLGGACRLLLLAILPMLVMTLPMCLLLAQLALWYQARPLRVGEEAVLTVLLAGDSTRDARGATRADRGRGNHDRAGPHSEQTHDLLEPACEGGRLPSPDPGRSRPEDREGTGRRRRVHAR